jgi:hypothetical protein
MTTTQFFVILGTIYLIPDMHNTYRKWIGLMFIVLAVIVEFVK